MIKHLVYRHSLVIVAITVWIVLVVTNSATGVQQLHDHEEPFTKILETPASWFEPFRRGLNVVSAHLPHFGGQLLPGLAIGDVSRVTDELDESMKVASLTHLVAVSGANCQIVTVAVYGALSWAGVPRVWRIGGALCGLIAFVLLVAPGASIARAAVMSGCVLVGMARGRLVAGLPALGFSILVLLILNSRWATNFGFVLSVLATLGLLTLTRPIVDFLSRWMASWLATVLAVPVAAALLCQPVIVLLTPSLPTYGVLANILTVPAAGISTVVGVLVALGSVVHPTIGELVAWIAWLPAEWIGLVATGLAAAPLAKLDWPTQWSGVALAVLVSAAIVVVVRASRSLTRVVAAGMASGVLGIAILLTSASTMNTMMTVPAEWRIAACDVGQGDAFLIRSRDSSNVWQTALIDTGREPTPVQACLNRLRIDHLDLLVLTHYDLDHVGGVPAVAGKADRVIVGVTARQSDERTRQRACAGVEKCELGSQGMVGYLGTAKWRILWPNRRTPEMQSGNPGSVTIHTEWPDLSALFTGDLGQDAQNAMLADNTWLPVVDVLKVAHHGSADTSEKLVNRVSPRIALISVGRDNGYGHPTEKALSMLDLVGARIGRTDQQGMLFVVGGRHSLNLVTDR